ncbi:Glucose-repressible protein [Fusarium oxysporum f. sp. albedinis]|nr:Glucose-repressible protein [Fusarium oxysporum f. sp. albedinis]
MMPHIPPLASSRLQPQAMTLSIRKREGTRQVHDSFPSSARFRSKLTTFVILPPFTLHTNTKTIAIGSFFPFS